MPNPKCKAVDYVDYMTDKEFRQEWYCTPPDKTTRFRVTRDEWSDDCRVRRIYEWIRVLP